MSPEQFAYWLNGFAELSPGLERPSAAQWEAIKAHLATVFVKVTPPVHTVGPGTTGPNIAAPARHPLTPPYDLVRLSEFLRQQDGPISTRIIC